MPFHVTSDSSPLSLLATTIVVSRYDTESGNIAPIPNVVCDGIDWEIGARVSAARLRYLLDTSGLFPQWPDQYEHIWPQTANPGPYVLSADDRIIVVAHGPNGGSELLFDGFAQAPQVNFDGNSQQITVNATGVECRCWDVPITGRAQRDYAEWHVTTGDNDFYIDSPVRMNPSHGRDGIIPNCTPTGCDTNEGADNSYPVFMDELVKYRTPGADEVVEDDDVTVDRREFWTVDRAVRYLLYFANKTKPKIEVPDAETLTDMLSVRTMTAADDGTLTWGTTTKPVAPLRDIDLTNKTWPEAVEMLLRTVGFGCYFDCAFDCQGLPKTYFRVYQINDFDNFSTVKNLKHDRYGSTIDPARNNVASAALSRDISAVVNAWGIETHPIEVEISVVLAPGFVYTSGDETGTTRKTFLRSNLTFATAEVRAKYRRYIADCLGMGHFDGLGWVTTPLDLSPIWPDKDGKRTYVQRIRRGRRTLLTKDDTGKPREAVVHYSTNYTGDLGKLWDGSATWNPMAVGEWALLEDELGIRLTVEDPESINVVTSTGGKSKLKGISSYGTALGDQLFALMLTTVIQYDYGLFANVPARSSSPTKYARFRRHDARDHYQGWMVAYPSTYNNPEGPPGPDGFQPIILRDDTDKALQLATEYRAAHEMPPLAGSVTVPYYTTDYRVGDRIQKIEGRDCWLRVNTATYDTDNEQPMYPIVVKVAWNFQDQQTTTLHLSDLRAEPRG